MIKTLKRFLESTSGNFAIPTAFVVGPILMGVTLAVDYSELVRRKTMLISAMDAAAIAAARLYQSGEDEDDVKQYAREFFDVNLGKLDRADSNLVIRLPDESASGLDIELESTICYDPYFYAPALRAMAGAKSTGPMDAEICVDEAIDVAVRVKSTAEIALVLDNSGSMAQDGVGSNQPRIDLLKKASKDLVTFLSADARRVRQVANPLQFSLVPFSGSVNIGAQHRGESWMDNDGTSPIHHENFNWSTMPTGYEVTRVAGSYRKTGLLWPIAERNQIVSRFTLFDDMKRRRYNYVSSGNPSGSYRNWDSGTSFTSSSSTRRFTTPRSGSQPVKYADWAGCVEMRPWPHSVTDEAPTASDPATLYVPIFAPDEPGDNGYFGTNLPSATHQIPEHDNYTAYNSYFSDFHTNRDQRYTRQVKMGKYFSQILPQPHHTDPTTVGLGVGPNLPCTNQAITPLSETVSASGEEFIHDAIDSMTPNGSTNVTQGIVWGMATLSHHAPFTEGRPEVERGNEKIMIVLTDGKNTYYTPSSLGVKDPASNGSIYGSYGYTGRNQPGELKPRIFMGTSSPVTTSLDNNNYTNAMIQHMGMACQNAKDSNIRIFTVALDLDYNSTTGLGSDKKMAEALKACASYSRIDEDRKLFWNTTGGSLDETFQAIADELSNLRIVS